MFCWFDCLSGIAFLLLDIDCSDYVCMTFVLVDFVRVWCLLDVVCILRMRCWIVRSVFFGLMI